MATKPFLSQIAVPVQQVMFIIHKSVHSN